MNIDIRDMRQVYAISKEGSFAKAARVLHISQPALSRSIKEVERKAGFKIFERSREGTTLTDLGHAFIMQSSDILALADNMDRELAHIKGLDSGELNVGSGIFVSDMFVGEAVAAFAKPGANVRIRMINEQPDVLMSRLIRREVDIAIGDPSWVDVQSGINQIKLHCHQGYLVARRNHPLFSSKRITFEDVVLYPLVTMSLLPNRVAMFGKTVKGNHAKQQQKLFERWVPSITVNSITTMKAITASTDAITLVPLKMVRHELERRELLVLPINLSWFKPQFSILHLAHRTLSPLADAVTKAIVAEDEKLLAIERDLAGKWFKPSLSLYGGKSR